MAVIINENWQQPEDCCGRRDLHVQNLKVVVEDGGGGPFVVIETERFALDLHEIEKLCDHLRSLIMDYERSDLCIK